MGLDWLHAEIAAFGGDPDRITLMGHSSGAMAVGLLTVLPVVRGKFAQATLLSGMKFPGS